MKKYVFGVLICSSSCSSFINKRTHLPEFEVKNGRYFPEVIENFFNTTKLYYKDYPTIQHAKSDMRIIEIKQLSTKKIDVNEANLSWSADGLFLGYETISNSSRDILLKDIAGNFERKLFVLPNKKDNFLDGFLEKSIQSYNSSLKWSKDSNQFAFMSNGGRGIYNIYIGSVGKKEEIIAKSQTKDGYPSWNPLNDEIAFVSSRTGGGDIYTIPIDGSNQVTRISTNQEADLFPEWFPDGNKIIYSSGTSQNHNIKYVSRTSRNGTWGKEELLTDWQQDSLRPTVSPDGRFIAFYAGNSQTNIWNIYVVPFRSSPYKENEIAKMAVANNVVVDLNTGPAWSPDSKKIFYVSKDPDKFNPIFGYDLYSGKRFLLETNTKMNRDLLISRLGVISFRAQVGAWDKVYVALTNQGLHLQNEEKILSQIHYINDKELL